MGIQLSPAQRVALNLDLIVAGLRLLPEAKGETQAQRFTRFEGFADAALTDSGELADAIRAGVRDPLVELKGQATREYTGAKYGSVEIVRAMAETISKAALASDSTHPPTTRVAPR